MIYVVADDDAQKRALWVSYTEHCIEWRIKLLECTQTPSGNGPPHPQCLASLATQIRGDFRSVDTKDHWTDALALWQQQPSALREIIVASVSAKLSVVPAALGLVDTPRRFVYLPSAAGLLTNAVADVARDANIIWTFRAAFVGEEDEATRVALSWRTTAYALAALCNRVEYAGEYHISAPTGLAGGGRSVEEISWAPYRLSAGPDIPDLELVPSWDFVPNS
jgi:hypothetical protein